MKKAELTSGDRHIFLRAMTAADISRVAALYARIAVTADNCSEKLSGVGSGSFSEAGGMFEIQNEASLRALLAAGAPPVLLAVDAADELHGLLLFASKRWAVGSLSDIRWTGDGAALLRQAKEGRLAYGGEIIVSPDSDVPFLYRALFAVMFEALQAQGIDGVCGEVYRVVGYWDTMGDHETDLLNLRSLSSLQHIGAQVVGTLPPRPLATKGYGVTVEPVVLHFELARMLDGIRKFLTEHGVSLAVTDEEDER